MKIGMVTGSRSDWGLLRPLAKLIEASPEHELMLAVIGSHFSPEHGDTWREIDLPTRLFRQAWAVSPCLQIGLVVDQMGSAMQDEWRPDCLIVLGDRYESFAAAAAAHMNNVPVVHIHGGELTGGAIDDGLRHSITHFSKLHFVAHPRYRDRVVQLGEDPQRVFVVGSIGTDGLMGMRVDERKNQAILVWHPVTLAEDREIGLLRHTLNVLPSLFDRVIVIGANADSGWEEVDRLLHGWCAYNGYAFCPSMPRVEFLRVLAESKCIIGNSSAGIIEAPALGVTTINIGTRQDGRLKAASVYDLVDGELEVFRRFMETPTWKNMSERYPIPYGSGGDVAGKIIETISNRRSLLTERKVFHDAESVA